MKVLLTWAADGGELERIRARLPSDAKVVAPERDPYRSRYECAGESLLGEAGDADVLMGWVAPREVIGDAAALRLIVWLHAGCDQLDFELLRRRGIRVANVSGSNAGVVAEQALMFMLGLAKRVLANHRGVRDGVWRPWWDPEFASGQLAGRVLAVVGLGRVGTEVAKRARAFGMHILGVKRNPECGGESADKVYPPQSLHEVLAEADFVVLALPLTPRTRNLIGEAELRVMKPRSFLVNVARGHIVTEAAVYRALTEGWIEGFASDVWWDYGDAMPPSIHFPVPSRHGVHKLPNVLASGDASADILEVKDAMLNQGLENLAAFARGDPLPREVNLDSGY